MKNKVALVSCYFKDNYGSLLQTYALQRALIKNGIDCANIDISGLDRVIGARKRKYYLSQFFNYTFLKQKFGMVALKIRTKIDRKLKSDISIRRQKFERFRENFFVMSRPYSDFAQLTKNIDGYTDYIVGSDQLWLPVNVVGDYYTLNFVPDNINKVSYSTSFGVSVVPEKYKKKYVAFLNRINHLSVREKTGRKLVKELTGRDAELVCDPTLLLTQQEWLDLAAPAGTRVNGDYIFCYFLGKNIIHRKFAERLKAVTGYKIVSINHCDEYVKYSEKFADDIPYDVGPQEFLYLIKNAKYVLSDSFHGTVFSLVMNTPFFSFRRFTANKVSTNSRLDTLLEVVGLTDRILNGDEEIQLVISSQIHFDKVNSALEDYRQKSQAFLIGALDRK